jgi:hypothetical protein
MRNRTFWTIAIVAAGAMVGFVNVANAAPPWNSLLSFKRVEANPEKPYQLSEQNGPWLIMASSFSGEGAEKQAHELVLELRKHYKLPAYVHNMHFDLGKDADGRGVNRYGEPIKWRYKRGAELEEIAVLVGDFPAVDDPEAEETLKKIKYSRPTCLEVGEGKQTNQSLATLRYIQQTLLKSDNEKKKKGPMGHAFIVPNPLLKDQIIPKGLDPLVVKMNKGLKYGLLDCPGKYTVQVAHFTGKVIVDQGQIRKIENGEAKLKQSSLDEAANKAHRLTEALRAKGYEAYEFHDVHASIVTVGSFNSMGTPRPDGQTEINPEIFRIMETFKGQPPAAGGPIAAQLVADIPLDLQPIPVNVPKESISAAYARKSDGPW